jgi:hypothetical protein
MAIRTNAPYIIILLCLTPDKFTRQGESAGAFNGLILATQLYNVGAINWATKSQ